MTPRLVENGRKVHERHIVCVFGQRKHYADVRYIDDNAFVFSEVCHFLLTRRAELSIRNEILDNVVGVDILQWRVSGCSDAANLALKNSRIVCPRFTSLPREGGVVIQ